MPLPRLILSAVLVLAVTMLASPNAEAKKPDFAGGGHGGGKSLSTDYQKGSSKKNFARKSHDKDNDINVNVALQFNASNRNIIQTYLRDNHAKQCPPGLAKKHNGCLPPGQAKKYTVGGVLPVHYDPLPSFLLQQLGPPPASAFYAMVDQDVLLVSEAGKKILDAVTLLSAVK